MSPTLIAASLFVIGTCFFLAGAVLNLLIVAGIVR